MQQPDLNLAEMPKVEQGVSVDLITSQGQVVVMRDEKDMFSSDFKNHQSD